MQTTLRKVGGSVMMTVSPAVLEQLSLTAGSAVNVELQEGAIIVKPARKRYTAKELLEGYEPEVHRTEEDRIWLDSPPVGRELI